MMKKINILNAVIEILVTGMLLILLYHAYTTMVEPKELLPRLCVVTEINEVEDYVEYTDCYGFTFRYGILGDEFVGDYYIITLYNKNHTKEIFDDIIIDVTYTRPDMLHDYIYGDLGIITELDD